MSTPPPDARQSELRPALIFWSIAALFVAVAAVVHVAAQPLLLAFLGVLFGTSLRGLAEWLAHRFGASVRATLCACIGVLVLLSIATAMWLVPRVIDGAAELGQELASAYEQVHAQVAGTDLGRRLLSERSTLQELLDYLLRAAGALASGAGFVGAQVFVLFVAIYTAFSPKAYRLGVLRLVPKSRRDRAGEILNELASTLRRWMAGRIVSMTAVGLVTTVGLMLLGIPLPIMLGLAAALLGFVPNIGPLISALPALLLAATLGPEHIVSVLVLYLAVNFADGYLLTPLLQKRAVSTPPALVLTSQVVFGALWGVVGITVATPLIACVLVLVRTLYIEDMLERRGG